MTRPTDIEQEASQWIIRGEATNFTAETRAELEGWLAQPRNRVAFVRVREAWRRASRVTGVRPLDGNVDMDLLKHPGLSLTLPKQRARRPWRMAVAAAAGLALCVFALVAWNTWGPAEWSAYSTSIGGFEHVTLADGTVLKLNTNTEVRTRLTADKREMELVHGEAVINVARDARRSFTVKAAGAALRAEPSAQAGPSVAVRLREPGGIDISILEGSVALSSSYSVLDVALGRVPLPESTLKEGEVAAIRPEGIHLSRVAAEELNRKLSWTAGLLSFQGETLVQVAEEFNRYNRRQMVVMDPAIAGRRIGGAFQATDPDSFTAALEKWFGVRVESQGSGESGTAVIKLRTADSGRAR
jgi:transmembrane sensor